MTEQNKRPNRDKLIGVQCTLEQREAMRLLAATQGKAMGFILAELMEHTLEEAAAKGIIPKAPPRAALPDPSSVINLTPLYDHAPKPPGAGAGE